jgi:hypothetical protein
MNQLTVGPLLGIRRSGHLAKVPEKGAEGRGHVETPIQPGDASVISSPEEAFRRAFFEKSASAVPPEPLAQASRLV